MSDRKTQLEVFPVATAIRVSMCSIDCPNCDSPQEGWLKDPRGGEHMCDGCGTTYRVPEDVRLVF